MGCYESFANYTSLVTQNVAAKIMIDLDARVFAIHVNSAGGVGK